MNARTAIKPKKTEPAFDSVVHLFPIIRNSLEPPVWDVKNPLCLKHLGIYGKVCARQFQDVTENAVFKDKWTCCS